MFCFIYLLFFAAEFSNSILKQEGEGQMLNHWILNCLDACITYLYSVLLPWRVYGTCKCNTIKTDRVMSPCSAAQVPVPTEYWRARTVTTWAHYLFLSCTISTAATALTALTIHLITISWENGKKDGYGGCWYSSADREKILHLKQSKDICNPSFLPSCQIVKRSSSWSWGHPQSSYITTFR